MIKYVTCDYVYNLKKFDGTGDDPDDLISIGTIGLIKAINTFNLGKGTRLATYAARCIENESLMSEVGRKKALQNPHSGAGFV